MTPDPLAALLDAADALRSCWEIVSEKPGRTGFMRVTGRSPELAMEDYDIARAQYRAAPPPAGKTPSGTDLNVAAQGLKLKALDGRVLELERWMQADRMEWTREMHTGPAVIYEEAKPGPDGRGAHVLLPKDLASIPVDPASPPAFARETPRGWSGEQREAANAIYQAGAPPVGSMDKFCAEIAKHAHLFHRRPYQFEPEGGSLACGPFVMSWDASAKDGATIMLCLDRGDGTLEVVAERHAPTIELCWRAFHGAPPSPPPETRTYDLVAHIERQREWSRRTFGEGYAPERVVRHIEKELAEVRAAPRDVTEWVDVVLLALDGAWRAGHEPAAIAEAVRAKQAKNFARSWPPPSTTDEPNEHIRAAPRAPAEGIEKALDALTTECSENPCPAARWWYEGVLRRHLPPSPATPGPIVMPERKSEFECDDYSILNIGWNECLAELRRLNPGRATVRAVTDEDLRSALTWTTSAEAGEADDARPKQLRNPNGIGVRLSTTVAAINQRIGFGLAQAEGAR